jgi:hypothetical protein
MATCRFNQPRHVTQPDGHKPHIAKVDHAAPGHARRTGLRRHSPATARIVKQTPSYRN